MRDPRVRPRALAALAVGGALLLSSCSSDGTPAASSEPVDGGTLVYATGDAEPTCLDPSAMGGGVPQALLATQFLESLFYQDENGEIQPWLAESWSEGEGGMSWDVTVRDGVRFTDGTPLTSATVKANIEHIKDPATRSSTAVLALAKVSGVEIVDERTARIVLTSPDSALLESLAMVWLPMQSERALERSVEENCEAPVGTGPFAVEEWKKQEAVTLVRNDDYTTPPPGAEHEGPAHLERIEWRFIPDPTARFSALQAGQAGVIDALQPESVPVVESDPELDTMFSARPGHPITLVLNSSRAPFDDIAVREAFIRSADIDAGIGSVFFDSVERVNSPLGSTTRFGTENPEAFSYDPEAAEKLLDEAGWDERDDDGYRVKDGERLRVSFAVSASQSIPADQAMFEQLQATAKETGFEVELRPLELANWYEAVNSWDYDVSTYYYTKNSPDVLRIIFHSANIEPAASGFHTNVTGLSDPELDRILIEASETSDEAQRESLYAEAQQIIADSFVVLPIYDNQSRTAYRTEVAGMRVLPSLGFPTFYDAWLSE